MPIRVFDAGAPDAVFEFLDQTFAGRGRAHWRWKYRLGAGGPPAALYFESKDGRVLGFIGMMHTSLEHGSQRTPAAWFVDWHVVSGEGTVGVGIALLRKAEAAAGSLLTLQGSADTRQILPQLGWKESLGPAVFVRPLTSRYVASLLGNRLPAGVRIFARLVAAASRPMLRCRQPAAPRGVTLTRVERFAADYDQVWKARAAEFAPAMTRDSEYLNYLCADYPDGGYSMQLVRDGEEVVGHLVTRIDTDRAGLRRGRIIDFLWPRRRGELASWLVRTACHDLQSAGADYVEIVASNTDVRAAMPKSFRRRRALPIWYHLLPAASADPDCWHVTFLDCDRAYR